MDQHEQQRDVHDQLLADFPSLWRPVGKGRPGTGPVPGGKNLSTVYSIIILITPLVLTIHTAKSKFRSSGSVGGQQPMNGAIVDGAICPAVGAQPASGT